MTGSALILTRIVPCVVALSRVSGCTLKSLGGTCILLDKECFMLEKKCLNQDTGSYRVTSDFPFMCEVLRYSASVCL